MRDASDVDSSVTAVREVLLTSTTRELNRAEESVYGLWCILQYIYIHIIYLFIYLSIYLFIYLFSIIVFAARCWLFEGPWLYWRVLQTVGDLGYSAGLRRNWLARCGTLAQSWGELAIQSTPKRTSFETKR